MTNQEKVIDKIKKLLELAASPETAEAELAMNTAKKLMEKYSVDASHLNEKEQVIYQELWTSPVKTNLAVQIFPFICTSITPIFGVHSLVDPRTCEVMVFGFRTNIEVAAHAVHSIMAQGQVAFKRGYRKYRSIAFADEFWKGYSIGVHDKFGKKQEPITEEGIVLYDKVKAAKDAQTSGDTYQMLTSLGPGFNHGINAGLDAEIRSGVGESTYKGNQLT